MLNIGALLFIIMFMYAVLGVTLFTFVARQDNLDHSRNFDTIGNAFLVLFQALTGDGWSNIMDDAMINESDFLSTMLTNLATDIHTDASTQPGW